MGKRKKVIPDEGTWKLQKIRVDLHRAFATQQGFIQAESQGGEHTGDPWGVLPACSSGPCLAKRCQPSGAVKFQLDKTRWTGERGVTWLEAKVFGWVQPSLRHGLRSWQSPQLQGRILELLLPSTLFRGLWTKDDFFFFLP